MHVSASHRPTLAARRRRPIVALLVSMATTTAACAGPHASRPDVRAELVASRALAPDAVPELRGGIVVAYAPTDGPAPRDVAVPTSPDALASVPVALEAWEAARFADEPDVLTVVRVALEVAGLGDEPVDDALRRHRRAGWVPELRLGAARARGIDATAREGTSSSTQIGRDDALRLEAQLTLSLGRVLYGADELAWARESRARLEARAALAREVVELYFRRRRLIVTLAGAPEDVETLLELRATEAMLGAFTNGAFGEMMTPRDPPP